MLNKTVYKGAVCKGCWELGNNCGGCEKCIATKPDMSLAYEGAREDLAIWKKRALEAEAKLKVVNENISDETILMMFQKMKQNPITNSYIDIHWFMSGVVVGQQFVKTMVDECTVQTRKPW